MLGAGQEPAGSVVEKFGGVAIPDEDGEDAAELVKDHIADGGEFKSKDKPIGNTGGGTVKPVEEDEDGVAMDEVKDEVEGEGGGDAAESCFPAT